MNAAAAARWLAVEEARAALGARCTLSPRAVERFSRHDRVAEVGGAVVAFEVLAPPVVSRTTVRIHAVDPAVTSATRRLHAAVAAARSLSPGARIQLRARPEAGTSPPAVGFAPFTLWIRKRPATLGRVAGAEVHPAAGAEDWEFVAGCHRQALRDGMPDTTFGADQLERYVRGALRIGRRGRPEALVCRIGGRRTGHVTWRPVTDRWTGRAVIDVVDVYVLKPDLGGPTGAALTAALDREVIQRRPALELLGNIVAEQGRERQVVERLARRGWRLDHVLWQLGR